jgi:outer membrane receptor protein involved in Fe transport
LLSARNSNLKYILDKDLGEPSYNDIFLSTGFNLSPDTRLTFNALRADDEVLIVTESAPEEREQSTSDTLNRSLWLTLENQWTPDLASITVLSSNKLTNDRDAIVLDPEQLVGMVMDDRDIDIFEFKQDWAWQANLRHFIQFGFEVRSQKANYRYISEAEYFGFYLAYPGVPESIERDIAAKPDGNSYALYLSDRIDINDSLKIELGIRWDKQTYLGPEDDDQFSPRASLFYNAGPRTDLRFTVGRYHQSQGIHELQVEDGVDYFYPAQKADHIIAGIHYKPGEKLRLRAEIYQKKYSDLRPRFENLQDSLALIPELEPDRARIAPDSARARGIELTLENQGNGELDWWASYTLSRVTDSIDGRNEKRNWEQKHALQAGIAWHKGPWEIGLAANIHSGWPTTSLSLVQEAQEALLQNDDEDGDEADYMLEFGPRNAENFSTFASIDFRVSRQWELGNSRITAFFELSNAFNRKNQCCIDYDIEDEDAEPLELEESIDYWLPILPAIGVLWEF